MKLVSALLYTMADFLLEHGPDASITSPTGPLSETSKAVGEDPLTASASPALRARLSAVIRSLSDDETARVLAISTRQVRRRAHEGDLHFFEIGRKRRYPCWQFIGDCRLLPGLREVAPALRRSRAPETIEAIMTTKHPRLLVRGAATSPVEWLVHTGDASIVGRLLDLEPRGPSEK